MNKKMAEALNEVSDRHIEEATKQQYWWFNHLLTAIEKALRSAGIEAGGTIPTELEQAAQDVKTAHDKVASLNDRLRPDKIF